MRNHHFNRFLRNEAHELGDGGGSATPAAAVLPEPALAGHSAATPAAAAPPREPSMLEKVQGAIRDKGVIIAENTGLKQEVLTHKGLLAERDGSITALTARISALETENTQLKGDLSGIDAALKSTQLQVATVDTSAAKVVARMGFEAADLPAAEKDAPTVEGLIAKMNATTDPGEKYKIAAQINKLEGMDI